MLGFLFICILCLFLIGAPIFVALGMGTTLSIMLEGNFPLVLYHRECLRVLTAGRSWRFRCSCWQEI